MASTSGLGQALVRLAFAVEAAYGRASRELGLTAQQSELLCAVGFDVDEDGRWAPAERGTRVGRLAAELDCDQSNVSRLVERAVKRGLLERSRGAEDGRVTLVELTSEGGRTLDRFIEILMETIDPHFADWPAERRRSALELLDALADRLEAAGEEQDAADTSAFRR